MGHASASKLQEVARHDTAAQLPFTQADMRNLPFCDHCAAGKMTKTKHYDSPSNHNFLDVVSMDLTGPVEVKGLNDEMYLLNCYDIGSSRGFGAALTLKSQADADIRGLAQRLILQHRRPMLTCLTPSARG